MAFGKSEAWQQILIDYAVGYAKKVEDMYRDFMFDYLKKGNNGMQK